MMSEPHILSLSPELLHSIATFVNHTDLPTLRLVSKQIGAAISDVFASEYLRELRCYVMDPARLQRLKAIASREHLTRKIRKVTLCLDPYEKKRLDDIVLAPPLLYRMIQHPFGWIQIPYSQYDAQVIARASYIHDQYTLHNRQNPNAALIVSILWDLRVVDCPCVELDLRQSRAYDDEVPQVDIQKSNTVPNAVLNAVFSSNCTLSGLTLDGDDFLRPEALGMTRVNTVESISRKLRSYTLVHSASHLVRSFGVQGSFDRWRAFTTGLLASTERLQALHLEVLWNVDSYRGSIDCVLDFASVILRTERLSFLTSLVLIR